MKSVKTLATFSLVLTVMSLASAQTWAPLAHQPGVNLGPTWVLRDGRILAHEEQSGNPAHFWILTPDSKGSYANGTWSSGGSLPAGYAPFYFGSNIQINGNNVVIEGGEYNNGSADWTTLGAIGTRSGKTFTWKANKAPTGWSTIGDAEAVTLADGKYMQSNCCTAQNVIFNGANTWTVTGSVSQSNNDESGFTLLASGKVLTVDAKNSPCGTSTAGGTELYTVTNTTTGVGTWACTGKTPIHLYNPGDEELGAAVLMYNGKVFQFGGNVVATAIYTPTTGTWAAGPTPANGLNQADGPAALEPNGKVLAMLSPGLFGSGCQMVEYSTSTNKLTNAPNPTNCPSDSSYVGHLLVVPSGQILFTDFSGTVELYTPTAGVASNAVPKITSTVHTFKSGSVNNLLTVTNLNGISQASAYGDDYTAETNYPVIRLKSSTGNVYYARTHDESTHSIAPGTSGTTKFDLPTLTVGSYSLYVVVNGIPSAAFAVTID